MWRRSLDVEAEAGCRDGGRGEAVPRIGDEAED